MTERGQLRVYLGAAPGVGKTYAMIDEGHRRAARGTDVVVAYVETHGRPRTKEKLAGLEVIPRRTVTYRGSQFTEMDLPAVLARAPVVALVDELAHTNVPGVEHAKRWEDIEQLLEAGITVISNVNIQHLESLNDVVQEITGIVQRETVPDSVVRAAEQVELVDMTAEALRRRMAHGNVYQLDRIDAALSNYFRPGNLTALRELALLWVADAVEDNLQRYREEHGIARKWETRERVVVALTGGPEGEALIRRAARIAARVGGGDLLAVHVARSDGLAGSSIAELDQQRVLVESLGGSYHSVVGDDIPAAVLEFARASNATQIVIGASRRNPAVAALTGPGTGMTITRQSGPIDVHVISHDYMGKGRVLPRLSRGLTRKRRIAALITATVLLTALVPTCAALRDELGFGSDLLLFLLAVIIVSLVGGFITALATAIAASLLLSYYFVPPIHKLMISQPENIFALVVFVVVALLLAKVVDVAARHSSEAARSNAEAEIISTLAGSLLRGEQAIPAMLERVRESFGARGAALLRRESGAPASRSGESAGMRGTWSCVASVGNNPCLRPEDADTEVPVGDDMVLVLRGRVLAAEDQRVLAAFATQVAIAYEQRRITEVAEAAAPLAEADRVRTALLNAVSHDLRTPLASAKAAVSSLRSPDVAWSDQDREEFLANADDALDRLTGLVTNLLDLSRLQVGVLAVETDPVAVDDVVSHAVDHAAGDTKVEVEIPPDLPAVAADPGLLERAIANLVESALRYSPPGELVRIAASAHRDTVQVRVIDHGPGIRPADREAVFAAFQRLDDHTAADGQGVGLGLAIARGFVEAMHGTITLDDTPGGGLIAAIELPIARPQ